MIIFLYRPFWSLSKRTQILISIFVEEHATQRNARLGLSQKMNQIKFSPFLSVTFFRWLT